MGSLNETAFRLGSDQVPALPGTKLTVGRRSDQVPALPGTKLTVGRRSRQKIQTK